MTETFPILQSIQPPKWDNFTNLFKALEFAFEHKSKTVGNQVWQGMDVSTKPEMAMHELRDVSFVVDISQHANTELWKKDVDPNYPWVDDHFAERVCGQPINPGVEWANWPWGNSADKFRETQEVPTSGGFIRAGQFNHNYMERYWPKFAGKTLNATEDADDFFHPEIGDHISELQDVAPYDWAHKGIRYQYGDLSDVVDLLVRDPNTRQAYLPVWFPEDTGGLNGRAPCTLGYQFMMRDGKLHITYFIRSCDYVRHMRDDVYLTLRLALWVLEQCVARNRQWRTVTLGDFQMHINSLHMFRNDYVTRYGAPA